MALATKPRGKSKQDYATPPAFIEAVQLRFGGEVAFDLAADPLNRKAERYYSEKQYPGCEGIDSLEQNWAQLSYTLGATALTPKIMWLNPPYGDIEPWAAKCLNNSPLICAHTYIALLVPNSTGSCWFSDHVWQKSWLHFVKGRVVFVGETNPFTKDLILPIFGNVSTDAEIWDWRNPKTWP